MSVDGPPSVVVDVGARIRALREERNLSIRELAGRADVAASLISRIEAGKTSPTVMTLQRIVNAFSIGFHEFFAKECGDDPSEQIVFPSAGMAVSKDTDHKWLHAFPRHPSIQAALTYEEYLPHTRVRERSRHKRDICGIVLEGQLTVEVSGRGVFQIGAGDAFYIKAGTEHASLNESDETVRLVAVMPHTRSGA